MRIYRRTIFLYVVSHKIMYIHVPWNSWNHQLNNNLKEHNHNKIMHWKWKINTDLPPHNTVDTHKNESTTKSTSIVIFQDTDNSKWMVFYRQARVITNCNSSKYRPFHMSWHVLYMAFNSKHCVVLCCLLKGLEAT